MSRPDRDDGDAVPDVASPPKRTHDASGLRRSDVAALADLSVQYHSEREKGRLAGTSAGVLGAIARALQLDDAERAHLFDRPRRQRLHGHRAPRPAPVPTAAAPCQPGPFVLLT